MSYRVLITDSAAMDLEDIYNYIAMHDAPRKADYILGKIEDAFQSLSEFPDRGSYPKELSAIGIYEYREIYFKPYRIIYKRVEKIVYISLIVDGRRSFQTILNRRLFEV
ncbi:MAG TPA: type II toxin-antitoxin system RelE/ParE family toxin [Gammaproteobacteria bacterium]|nr:type II toxin-antitoxin system RelE/ParE family toxin [Gammaproteobacteria bacterium]